MNKMYREVKGLLEQGGMETGEARAVALLLMEKVCGATTVEVLGGATAATAWQQERLRVLSRRVAAGEPVQYALGEAEFCGMTFKVAPGVLIPRKETEELVNWVVEEEKERCDRGLRVLDVGTGSGCIAVALAKQIEGAEVEAWDVSEEALRVARENVERMGVQVRLRQADVRKMAARKMAAIESQPTKEEGGRFEVVVSNPPYVCEEEAKEMERNVLEHEPRLALFVPDDDPLLFYRKIAELGRRLLTGGGKLYFEINRRFGQDVVRLLHGLGYQAVELRRDQFGNDRMVKAIKR